MPSASDHKSMHGETPLRAENGLVWVKNGYRDLSMEGAVRRNGGLFECTERDAVVRLELSAAGIEFILDSLPAADGFTDVIQYLRDCAKHAVEQDAWDKAVNR